MIRPRSATRSTPSCARPTAGRNRMSASDAAPAILHPLRRPAARNRLVKDAPSAVVGELHIEVRGGVAQDLHGPLQLVLALPLDPDLVRLNRSLYLETARFEDLHDFLCALLGDSLLQHDL